MLLGQHPLKILYCRKRIQNARRLSTMHRPDNVTGKLRQKDDNYRKGQIEGAVHVALPEADGSLERMAASRMFVNKGNSTVSQTKLVLLS